MSTDFNGRRVAIIGLAATGLAAARVLHEKGASVTVYDAKSEGDVSGERVRDAQALPGVRLQLGTPDPDLSHTDCVVPSPGVPRNAPVLQNAVRLNVPVLSEIEVAYQIARAPILAITGTNGKTTTTALLGAICREAGLKTYVAGNIAEDAGIRLPLIEAANDAPPSGVIIAEISSFQLEWVTMFRPRVAAWLNLSTDHQDRYADMDDYARAKANLFQAQTPDDWAVINDEDEAVLKFSNGVGQGQRVRFGLSRKVWSDAEADHQKAACAYLDGQTLFAENISPDAAQEIICGTRDIQLPGRHNIANVLAASAMALAFGIDLASVRAGIWHFRGVAHRMETVANVDGVKFVNNSMCTNPAAAAASLQAASGSPVIAIVGGKHKGGDLSPLINALVQYARHVVLIGDAAPEIAGLLPQKGILTWEMANTLPDAVRHAARHARTGDTVMLVPGCASFDRFTSFEQRGQIFRDTVRMMEGANR